MTSDGTRRVRAPGHALGTTLHRVDPPRRGAACVRGLLVVPLAWLVLAPTKTGDDLLSRSPLAIGDLHNVWVAWQSVDAFGGHVFRRWPGSLYPR